MPTPSTPPTPVTEPLGLREQLTAALRAQEPPPPTLCSDFMLAISTAQATHLPFETRRRDDGTYDVYIGIWPASRDRRDLWDLWTPLTDSLQARFLVERLAPNLDVPEELTPDMRQRIVLVAAQVGNAILARRELESRIYWRERHYYLVQHHTTDGERLSFHAVTALPRSPAADAQERIPHHVRVQLTSGGHEFVQVDAEDPFHAVHVVAAMDEAGYAALPRVDESMTKWNVSPDQQSNEH